MSPGGIPPVIHVSQYDSDFTIVFTLFSTVGDFSIESGTTAMVRGTKSSGTGYSADAAINISAKTVTVTGNQQMTAAAGQNVFEITLYKNNKEISSKNFILLCERAALDMDTIEDKTIARELDNLDQFVAEAEAAADRAENASVSLRAIKTALLNCFQHVAWTDEHGQDYYDALEVAFDSKELASITAVFTQGSATIYPDTPLDDLKQYLVVTANYTDSTSAPVTDYTLRGTLAVGTSTITVTYGGKTATFNVNVSSSYRYITTGDIYYQSGLVDFEVTDGNIEYSGKESTSKTLFAGFMLKPSIKHIKFIYKPSGEQSLRRNGLFRIIIARRGASFVGCDFQYSYLFTPNSSGNEYTATKDTSLSTVTCSDSSFIGASSSEWDGYFNNKEVDVVIENGTLTISCDGYYCTYSNAELIGFWIDGQPCPKLYDVKVCEESSWHYLTADDIDFQKGLTGFTVNDADIDFSAAVNFSAVVFKSSVKHVEFVYNPEGNSRLRNDSTFRVIISKSGTSLVACDYHTSYLFALNSGGTAYGATADDTLSDVTCNDPDFMEVQNGYFNGKTVEMFLKNGQLTVSSSGYFCTYTNAELIGFWPVLNVLNKWYDVKVYEE